MALKSTTVTITEGRDKGKKFRIDEPPAAIQEDWFLRCMLALGRRGVEIPPEVVSMGAAAIGYFGISHMLKLPSRLALKLARELMAYVRIVEPKIERALVDEDTEDMTTRLRLKGEVIKLAYGFFVGAAFRTLSETAAPDDTSKSGR